MEKMREEYEAWFCSTMPYKIAKESWFAVMDDGDYIIMDVQAGWAGWKASRAALCGKQSTVIIPEGWQLVPVEPTADQFGGMARDIIQWLRFTESKDQHSESLVKWLKDMGNEIPDWLYSEPEVNHLSKHVISKGSIAAIIYKAMLAAAPKPAVKEAS